MDETPPSYWEQPPPAEPVPTLEESFRPPGAVEIISRGIDLNVSQSAQVRRASIYAGLLFLAAMGPIAALVLAHSIRVGGFDWIVDVAERRVALDLGPLAPLVILLGGLAAVAISVDIQLIAVALIGAKALGRPLDLRDAVRAARSGFWRLIFASIAVGLILIIPRLILSRVITPGSPQGQALLSTALDILLSAPFAFVGAAIVLGRASPLRSVRLSWRTARRRWRLAVVVGVVNTAVSYLAGFAVGAGLDILFRIAIALGIDRGLGPAQSVEIVAIVVFAIVAFGSLTMTIASLTVGPQVVAWLGLGGPAGGLDDAAGSDTASRPRLVTLPMTAYLAIEAVAALLALGQA
jgi:hypothetical protein